MIQATITGRLGADPESKTTKAGKEFASFRIASKGRNDEPTWVRCTVWRPQLVEFVLSNARKGARVCVGGALEERSWGEDNSALELDCSVLELYDWPDREREAIDDKASSQIGAALAEPYAPKRRAKVAAAQARHKRAKAQLNTDRAKQPEIDEEMPF